MDAQVPRAVASFYLASLWAADPSMRTSGLPLFARDLRSLAVCRCLLRTAGARMGCCIALLYRLAGREQERRQRLFDTEVSLSHYVHSISIFQPCRAASSTTSSSSSACSSSVSVAPSSQAVGLPWERPRRRAFTAK